MCEFCTSKLRNFHPFLGFRGWNLRNFHIFLKFRDQNVRIFSQFLEFRSRKCAIFTNLLNFEAEICAIFTFFWNISRPKFEQFSILGNFGAEISAFSRFSRKWEPRLVLFAVKISVCGEILEKVSKCWHFWMKILDEPRVILIWILVRMKVRTLKFYTHEDSHPYDACSPL